MQKIDSSQIQIDESLFNLIKWISSLLLPQAQSNNVSQMIQNVRIEQWEAGKKIISQTFLLNKNNPFQMRRLGLL